MARPFVRQYPRGELVVQLMGDGGPINQCGDTFMEHWLAGLDDADLNCNDRGAWDSTGAFPEKVAQQKPIARSIASSDDQSTLRDRRIAVIAVSALRDYLLHDQRPPVEQGRGLRGGSWEFTGSTDTTWDIAYHGYRWTDDLRFSGTGHFAVVLSGTSSIPDLFHWSVDLRVADSSERVGTLHLVTEHRFEHDARATITGTLYGRSIAVTAPAL
jgi:hypothetical protein